MAGRLEGKVAIITGGVSGMGLTAAELYVKEGAKVVVADIQVEKGLAMEKRLGGAMRFARCDIREEEDWKAAVAMAVDAFGGLDIMYHNAAAVGDNTPLDEISVTGWDDTQAMLVRASMLAIKHAIPPMRKRGGGSIILTSSASCMALGGSGPYAYTIGKGAVIHMGRYAALQLGKDLIRVNVIIPGAYPTSIWSGHVGGDANMGDAMDLDLSRFARMQALPVAGDTKNIAEAAVYLGSDASAWVTGVALPVDGGLSLFRNAYASAEGQLGAVADAANALKND